MIVNISRSIYLTNEKKCESTEQENSQFEFINTINSYQNLNAIQKSQNHEEGNTEEGNDTTDTFSGYSALIRAGNTLVDNECLNDDDCISFSSSSTSHKNSDDYKTKYKTEVCRFWEINQTCKFGENVNK